LDDTGGAADGDPLLSVRGLRVRINERDVVDGLDLELQAGELACVVGESGSGKSLTALSLMHLLPEVATSSVRRAGCASGS
jgi:ABC-type glutathione transport system ATPase component